MFFRKFPVVICFLFLSIVVFGQSDIKVSSDFAGGNIVVNKIDHDTVWLEPDLAFTEGEWFYWYFKISGISGKIVTFRFAKNDVFTKFGPAYSINNDYTWKWYGEGRVSNDSFSYSFSKDDSVAFFCIAFPYTEKDLNEFLTNLTQSESLQIGTLCSSPEGRAIEKITIPSFSQEPENRVLITARHHSCEMMTSYVLEGIIKSILNNKDLEALRKDTEFMIIPFVDKDGVENGEQGKNRIPRDHNRDYDGKSIHNSTTALREMVPGWSNQKLKFVLDLHCPWIKGDENENIYSVGSSNNKIEKNQKIFTKLLENNTVGELKVYYESFLPFGKSWNTAANYSKGTSFTKWASGLDGISISTSLEFPYANVSGVMVSKDNARIFGEAVAYSIKDYFENNIFNIDY